MAKTQEESQSDSDARDAQSTRNKLQFLSGSNTAQPTLVEIPLDPDLISAYVDSTGGKGHQLTPEEVLLVQVIRLLRKDV